MGVINQRFIEEANRIREDYLGEMIKLTNKEDEIKIHQNRLLELMEEINIYIKNNSDVSEEQISVDLKNELFEIENTLDNIKKEVAIFDANVKSLKKASSVLFNSITEQYPELSEEDIQKEILYKINY